MSFKAFVSAKFLYTLIDGVKFPVATNDINFTIWNKEVTTVPEPTVPMSKMEYQADVAGKSKYITDYIEDVAHALMPKTRKTDNIVSRLLNSLIFLSSVQSDALDELCRSDALVPYKYVYEFYYLDCNNRIMEHDRDELPSHRIYICVGNRRMMRAIKKRLKALFANDYGSSIHVIRHSYDEVYNTFHKYNTVE